MRHDCGLDPWHNMNTHAADGRSRRAFAPSHHARPLEPWNVAGPCVRDLTTLWKEGLSNVEKREGVATIMKKNLIHECVCMCTVVFDVDVLVGLEVSKLFIVVGAAEFVAS